MQKYQNSLQNRQGDVIAGAAVTVTIAGTATPAALFSDNGVKPILQQITTDANGYFSFYAANGKYDIAFAGSTFTADKWRDVDLFDLADADFPSSAALAAPGGASLVGYGARNVAAKLGDVVSVKDSPFNAVGNGVTDDTAAVQAAIDAVSAAGGGTILLPVAGNIIVSGLVLKDRVTLEGIGKGVTTIKLMSGANAHTIQAGDYDVNADGVLKASPVGCKSAGLKCLTVDGNKAGQSVAKHALAYYGIDVQLEEVEFKNARGINLAIESPGATFSVVVGQNLQPSIRHIECHDAMVGNLYYNGQSDTNLIDVLLYEPGGSGAGQYNARFGTKSTGSRIFGMHCWGTSDYAVINEGNLNEFIGCHAESASVAKVWAKARLHWNGGRIYEASAARAAKAFILLEDYNKIDTVIDNVDGGLVDFSAGGTAGGNSDINILSYTSAAGAILYNGTAPITSILNLRLFGGTTANLCFTPYKQVAYGGLDLSSSGIDRVNYFAGQGWAPATVASGNLPVVTSFVVISPGSATDVTDITSGALEQGILQVTIRNSGAGVATFKHNTAKLRNNGLADKGLNQYESITYTHVSGAVWQQTGGK